MSGSFSARFFCVIHLGSEPGHHHVSIAGASLPRAAQQLQPGDSLSGFLPVFPYPGIKARDEAGPQQPQSVRPFVFIPSLCDHIHPASTRAWSRPGISAAWTEAEWVASRIHPRNWDSARAAMSSRTPLRTCIRTNRSARWQNLVTDRNRNTRNWV